MTMKTIMKYIVLAAMLLAPMISNAQALPFTAAETDASSLRKAGADIVETGSVAGAAFSNAAAVPFFDGKFDAEAGYTLWGPTGSGIINAAGSYNIGNKLGVAAGFTFGMDPAYDVTDQSGASKGTYKPSHMQVAAGFAYRFLPYLSAGANVGYASSSLAEGYSYGAVTADVFLMGKFANFKVAAGVSNIGGGVVSANGTKFSLPTAVTIGAGYDKVFAEKHGVNVNVDVDYFLSDGLALAVGAEYGFNELVFVSAGYRYGGNSPIPSYASVGIGAKFKGIKLDAAYLLGSDVMKNTLAIGLGYSF